MSRVFDMNKFCIFTDSSCDLPAKLADDLGVTVIPLQVIADGKSYVNYLDEREVGFHEYYDMLRRGLQATTTAANMDTFMTAFEPVLEQGSDILYLGFSSGLSGTYNSGRMAAEELSEKYPDRKILAVDTLCASLGQGLMIYHAVQQQRDGKSIEEVRDWVEQKKLNMCHLFTVDDLRHLYRGGRVSRTTAIVGSALGMKPLMHMDDDGHLTKTGVVRGRKSSLDSMVKRMKELVVNSAEQMVFISHGDCLEEAEYLAGEIRKAMPVKDIVINYVGPVIGTHSGPGTMALFFFGTER